jgi:glycerol uptake facilitator-like aquaporin
VKVRTAELNAQLSAQKPDMTSLSRKLAAETVGTAFLLVAVVGSGIMGETLANGDLGMTLLANSLATGAALVALILTFAPISGAHFNPVVTLALASHGEHPWREVPAYTAAQVIGAFLGVFAAHAMFGLPMIETSTKLRNGLNLGWSESVATFGLLAVILSGVKWRPESVPYAVAAYITGAYWFTASTSFANPAVTLARAVTDSFTGIHPANVPMFIAAQVLGAGAATAFFGWLVQKRPIGERS